MIRFRGFVNKLFCPECKRCAVMVVLFSPWNWSYFQIFMLIPNYLILISWNATFNTMECIKFIGFPKHKIKFILVFLTIGFNLSRKRGTKFVGWLLRMLVTYISFSTFLDMINCRAFMMAPQKSISTENRTKPQFLLNNIFNTKLFESIILISIEKLLAQHSCITRSFKSFESCYNFIFSLTRTIFAESGFSLHILFSRICYVQIDTNFAL